MGNRVRLPPFTRQPYALDIPQGEVPYGVEYLGAPTAHRQGINGEGELVAVVDTGCDPTHPDLAGRVLSGRNMLAGPGSVYSDPNDAHDDHGHGSHCSGIVAASGAGVLGVAPGAKILPVKVLDGQGSGDDELVSEGIAWAADRAQVISLSLGAPSESAAMHQAIQYAVGKGCIVVAAAGNSGNAPDGAEVPAGDVTAPGSDPLVIAVAAIDRWLYPTAFSSYGAAVFCAAPGEDVLSLAPGGGYAVMSGTSMATPHIAGLAALWLQAGKPLGDFRAWLGLRAFHLGKQGRNVHTGYGLPSWLATGPGQSLRRISLTIGQLQYQVDQTLADLDVPPVIVGDRTLVPIRFVAEALGGKVVWDKDTRTAIIGRLGYPVVRIVYPPDSAVGNVWVDGQPTALDVPPQILHDRTMVPLRFVSETLGAQVTWNGQKQSISILAAVVA